MKEYKMPYEIHMTRANLIDAMKGRKVYVEVQTSEGFTVPVSRKRALDLFDCCNGDCCATVHSNKNPDLHHTINLYVNHDKGYGDSVITFEDGLETATSA